MNIKRNYFPRNVVSFGKCVGNDGKYVVGGLPHISQSIAQSFIIF